MPLTAHAPTPADQATDVKIAGSLKWVAGQSVMGHMVYLSADKAAVETGAPTAQVAAGPDVKYDYTGLVPFTTYYWRVDEIGSTGEIIAGPVWSFSTVTFLSMADAAVTLNYNNSAAPFTSQVDTDRRRGLDGLRSFRPGHPVHRQGGPQGRPDLR